MVQKLKSKQKLVTNKQTKCWMRFDKKTERKKESLRDDKQSDDKYALS